MLKYYHGIKNWDAHFTAPTFEFYLKLKIPAPNKDRLIIKRDRRGRIGSSSARFIVQ